MTRDVARAVAIAAFLASAVSMVPALAQDADAGSVRVVGDMPILHPGGYPSKYFSEENERSVRAVDLVVNPSRRRAYQLFELQHGSEQTRIAIRAFNLDTLAPLGPGRIGTPGYGEAPGYRVAQNNARNGFTYALDDAGGRLFLLAREIGASPFVFQFDLAALDEGRSFARRMDAREGVAVDAARGGRDYRGIDYYEDALGRGRLLILHSTGSPQFSPPARLDLWDAETGEAVWDQPFEVPKATCPATDMEPFAVTQTPLWRSRHTEHMFLMCKVPAEGNRPRLVRFQMDPATDHPRDPLLVPPTEIQGPLEPYAEAVADVVSDRILVVAGAQSTAYMIGMIDGRAGTYIGESGFLPQRGRESDSFALGVDPSSGRFYALAGDYISPGNDSRPLRGGLFIIHGNLTPIPQALQLPGFAYPSIARISVDPGRDGRPRRIFVRRGRGDFLRQCVRYPNRTVSSRQTPDNGCFTDQHYTVLIDPIAQPRQPSASDLDAHTQGVREVSDRTGRTFDAAGSAYGARVRFVGGLQGAMRNELTAGSGEPDTINREFEREVGGQHGKRLRPACWPTDREVVAARVARVDGSEDGVSAQATALQIDPATQEDLTAPGNRCRPLVTPYQIPTGSDVEVDYGPLDELAGFSLHMEEASCRGNTSDEQHPDRPVEKGGVSPPIDALPHGLGATVNCREGETRADGRADTTPISTEEGGLTVARSSAHVEMGPLDDGGMRVVSTAEVRSIRIGDVFIDVVRARAEAEAAGRRGTAAGSFMREVCGVRLGSGAPSPCYTEVVTAGCTVAPPDGAPESVADESQKVCEDDGFAWMIGRINQSLGGRGAFVARSPNAELERGTPGGYLAAVQKAEVEVIADSLLIRDFSLEVPGLEFTTYRDSGQYGPGRQVIQLAGVRAATTYGTYCLPPLRPHADQCVEDSLGGVTVPRQDVLSSLAPEAPDDTQPVAPSVSDNAKPRVIGPGPRAGDGIERARAFLVRSLTEGLLTTSIWMLFGIAAYLVLRRVSLSESIAKDG